MSTLISDKMTIPEILSSWTTDIPENDYHRAARTGAVLTSSMLKEFRACPAVYHAIVTGQRHAGDKPAFRFGRALHKLVLEGHLSCKAAFVVGGPCNPRTGRSCNHDSKAFRLWLEETGLPPENVLTMSEAEDLHAMHAAVRRHPEAAKLLAAGCPERTAAAAIAGVLCRARFDWLRPDGIFVDVKSTSNLDRFEDDARRFGYLHQFAFYRQVAEAAGAGELRAMAVVVEKRPPFRVGVWEFTAGILAACAAENLTALTRLRRCRENNVWPTGFETTRSFPPAAFPLAWLN